jgi:hypothetical protein
LASGALASEKHAESTSDGPGAAGEGDSACFSDRISHEGAGRSAPSPGQSATDHPHIEIERRSAMTSPAEGPSSDGVPNPDEPTIPEIEDDENVAPRPEEAIADVARAVPDVEDHGSRDD